jgi:glyoxylase-like metal-dependent hydrolase (beta-lactamase superfamily II)
MVTEVAPGLHRMALPLGIHGVETVSAYLLAGGDGRDTLVDCGVAARHRPDGDPGPDGTAALEAALAACGSGFERIERLVVTHAHIDHFGLAGRSCGAAAASCGCTAAPSWTWRSTPTRTRRSTGAS